MNFDILSHFGTGLNHRDEIDRLLLLERGNGWDIKVRLIGVPIGSVLLFLYTQEYTAFLWSGGYVACYAIYRIYMRSLSQFVSFRQQVIVHLLIIAMTISFLWMPSLMLVDTDRNEVLVGAALVGAQLVHLVHRGDTPLFLIVGTTAAVCGIMISLLISVLPQITEPVAIIGILVSWFALIFYLAQSMLAARTRILAENAARQQAFQAQKLSALGQLAGGIAHDFNNILTAISGNLELYKELETEAEKDEVITAAQHSSARAAKIVSQILIYARKSPVEMQTVDANGPLSSIAVLMAHLVPPTLQFAMTPLSTPRSVRIDPDQLVTALMNLILNAVDATKPGGQIKLTVRQSDVRAETHVVGDRILNTGSYVIYEVSDTGSGIPDHLLKSVVDPFFTTKPVGKGTGLGLSMAVSIADRVGGGLSIDTAPTGTVMRVFLPVAE